jgi:hypothetical protein
MKGILPGILRIKYFGQRDSVKTANTGKVFEIQSGGCGGCGSILSFVPNLLMGCRKRRPHEAEVAWSLDNRNRVTNYFPDNIPYLPTLLTLLSLLLPLYSRNLQPICFSVDCVLICQQLTCIFSHRSKKYFPPCAASLPVTTTLMCRSSRLPL